MWAWQAPALPQLSHRLSNLSHGQENGRFCAFFGGIKQKNPSGSVAGRIDCVGGFPTAEKTPAICHKSIDESLQSLFPTIHPSRF